MNTLQDTILKNLCYTELVYGRINKKLHTQLTNLAIETMLFASIKETEMPFFEKIGKNFYIINSKNNIKITVNANTYRVITVDKIQPKFEPKN
ncbi:DUF3781 domain-containing protein [Flavobacterium crassostreae]|uniref:DUF3781 domain-containing protein n=1 Tax=Flavobacterium crassostreae TaxID=1763534 RepID=A0A1B9DKP6_9FLAO|nr:DUF3781 domain-containing protein [Flavobacterium crassostreae]OCB70213.1 hypothetical protein LPBF_12270 [Flavobacterium crassostreae]